MVHIASSHQPGLHSETLYLRKERWGWIYVKSKKNWNLFLLCVHSWVSRCTYMGVRVCIHRCPGVHTWVSRCPDVCTWVSRCTYMMSRCLQMCMCLWRLEVDGRWLPELTSCPYSFRQFLSESGLINLARLAGHHTLGDLLFLPP